MHKTIFLAHLLFATVVSYAGDIDDLKSLKAEKWTVLDSGMEMKRIPEGTFSMGSPEDEMNRRSDETQREVTISKPFYMGVHVVRQSDYYEVMTPDQVLMPDDFDYDAWSYRRGPLHYGAAWAWRWPPEGIIHGAGATTHKPVSLSYPMTPVSWYDAMRFCRYLTEIERESGRLPEGYVYRLPTEAEWEYAARAGTMSPYSFDFDLDEDDKERFAQYVATTGEGGWTFGPVDTNSDRKPNPWGLKDMHGNVYEWCLDWYGLYKNDAITDPIGLSGDRERAERVARGGGLPDWEVRSRHEFYRSASRYSFPAHADYQINLGFRVVLAPEEPLSELAASEGPVETPSGTK